MLPFRTHVLALAGLAGPLAAAQLSFIAMGVTDTVLLGALGPGALAAGGLANQLAFTVGILLQSVLAAVSAGVSRARGGARPAGDVAVTGLLLAAVLVVPYALWQSAAPSLLRALGEPDALAGDVGAYLHILRWGTPGSMIGIGFMRAFLPAIGQAKLVLYASFIAAVVNGFLNYGLIHGVGPLPALGFRGSALATVITLWGVLLSLGALCCRPAIRREWRGGRVRRAVWWELLRVGLPIGATVGVETAVFLAIGLLMGLIGADALAAHQITLNAASICFMTPIALSQAANVRVAFFVGAVRPLDARRAGLAAIGMAGAFGVCTAAVLALFAHVIVGLYLHGGPANTVGAVALSLFAIAAVFQLVDGVQTVAVGALRGLSDTRVPFLIACFGYWVVGFGISAALGFGAGWGAQGLWWGLAAGLATVAVLMTRRFARISRVPQP